MENSEFFVLNNHRAIGPGFRSRSIPESGEKVYDLPHWNRK